MNRHLKDDAHDKENGAELEEGQHSIRNHLCQPSARGERHRRHGELLQRAAFALTHQAQRDQENDHDLQQNADETGNKKLAERVAGL